MYCCLKTESRDTLKHYCKYLLLEKTKFLIDQTSQTMRELQPKITDGCKDKMINY